MLVSRTISIPVDHRWRRWTIGLVHCGEDDALGSFLSMKEKKILLNGEGVLLDGTELDQLGNSGETWYEFAKGDKEKYRTIDDAVRVIGSLAH